MPSVHLADRGVVRVSGEDAKSFLDNLITCDLDRVSPHTARFGALLTPQGKILFDFIVFRDGDRFLFDVKRDLVADFVKRLGFYRLRAKVDIADISGERLVFAAWGGPPPSVAGTVAADPRLAALGFRGIASAPSLPPVDGYAAASESDYDAFRIALGVPEGGIDFAFGDAFPHDADMDQLGGVDFAKGCFIGQEVVSRMEHRGTARRRLIQAEADAALMPGAAITANGRPLGTVGSSADRSAIALIRVDRAKEAIDAGAELRAGETPVRLSLPSWARFGWSTAAAAGED
jgi:folate-binding protein YgfZ